MTEVDPRLEQLKHASKLRGEAQDHIVTVAAAALAISVTFRETLVRGAPHHLGALRIAWIALGVCVVGIVTDKLVNSHLMSWKVQSGTQLQRWERWILAAIYLLPLLAFGIGFACLAFFGLVNL